MGMLTSVGHGGVVLKLSICIVLAMVAARPAPASDLCDDVTKVLGIKGTLEEAPLSVLVAGETLSCSVAGDGARWFCKLASVVDCRPREVKGAASPMVGPGLVITRHGQVVTALKMCLVNRSVKEFQTREAITDDYVRVVKGTRFEDTTGRETLTPQVSLIGKLTYEPNQICEGLAAELVIH